MISAFVPIVSFVPIQVYPYNSLYVYILRIQDSYAMMSNDISTQAIFLEVLKNKNFITPDIIEYFRNDYYAIELSSGYGMNRNTVYGVTVLEKKDEKWIRTLDKDLSGCFLSEQEARKYITLLLEFKAAMEGLKEELLPFFEGLEEVGSSIFDCYRVWNVQRDLPIDDNSFQDELFEYLEDKYNCGISTESTDMGSFVVLHNDWRLDEWGNCTKIRKCAVCHSDECLDVKSGASKKCCSDRGITFNDGKCRVCGNY